MLADRLEALAAWLRTQQDDPYDATQLLRTQFALNLFQYTFSFLTIVLPSAIIANRVLSGELEVGRAVQAGGVDQAGGRKCGGHAGYALGVGRSLLETARLGQGVAGQQQGLLGRRAQPVVAAQCVHHLHRTRW